MVTQDIKINGEFYRKDILEKLTSRSPDGRSLILHDVIKGINTKWIIKNHLPKVVKEGLMILITNIANSAQSNIWNIKNKQVIHFNNNIQIEIKRNIK